MLRSQQAVKVERHQLVANQRLRAHLAEREQQQKAQQKEQRQRRITHRLWVFLNQTAEV